MEVPYLSMMEVPLLEEVVVHEGHTPYLSRFWCTMEVPPLT